ncbi:MAG: hypothetical protein H6710_02795 [Myxococcales bacterium]|nr:hypothetical protein [Myxococcales bacterium]MCB9703996.1 hypothetical protein [Myxococcales bacterium]
MTKTWTATFALALIVGCSGGKGTSASETSDNSSTSSASAASSTSTSSASASSTSGGSQTGSTSAGSASASAGSSGSSTGAVFIVPPDGGVGQCDPLAQDCPEGQKCTAVSPMEGEPWGVNVCVDVMGDGQVGDPCDVMNGKYTGLDNCAEGFICLLTDDDGVGGTCVEFCNADMLCPQSGAMCSVYNDGSLPICLANCDPLTQDCAVGQGCYPAAGGGTFVCFKTSVGMGEGGVGDGCNYTNQCQPGLMCAAPELVPDCAESGCCSPFCAVSEGNGVCLQGQECLPYFEMGSAPPGYEDVGVCALP